MRYRSKCINGADVILIRIIHPDLFLGRAINRGTVKVGCDTTGRKIRRQRLDIVFQFTDRWEILLEELFQIFQLGRIISVSGV